MDLLIYYSLLTIMVLHRYKMGLMEWRAGFEMFISPVAIYRCARALCTFSTNDICQFLISSATFRFLLQLLGV